jgi:uncharacterized Fe-S cluster-containing radical SAM superfamily protein
LLAIWGTDESGRPYVHVRIFKQSRIYGDVIAYDGEVKVRCRDCFRWHRIRFVHERAELVEISTPTELDNPEDVAETVMNEG